MEMDVFVYQKEMIDQIVITVFLRLLEQMIFVKE